MAGSPSAPPDYHRTRKAEPEARGARLDAFDQRHRLGVGDSVDRTARAGGSAGSERCRPDVVGAVDVVPQYLTPTKAEFAAVAHRQQAEVKGKMVLMGKPR